MNAGPAGSGRDRNDTAQIIITARSRQRLWPFLFVLVFALVFGWAGWMQWWDAYVPYSGLVVSKGEDYQLLARTWHHEVPYIILQDQNGKRSKRYVSRAIPAIATGTYVVKKRGFAEDPTDINGARSPESSPWWGVLEAGIAIALAVGVIRVMLQLWRNLSAV